MKFIPLHTKNTAIVYKNSICSSATIVVLVFIVLSVMVPVLLVSLLSPYSGISESRVLYEQPHLQFQFRNIFLADTEQEDELLVCSTFAAFNERMKRFGRSCAGNKYWTEDLNYDGIIDRAHFQLQLDDLQAHIKSYDLVLFFEAKLQHKCNLSPPAVLAHRFSIPASQRGTKGTIHLKAEMQLKQYIEFICPFPGRNSKTQFRQVKLDANASLSAVDVKQFQLESLLQQIKANPAFFELQIQETYFRMDADAEDLRILLDLNVLQVPARYHLSVWERLGQFWLYFASFFGVSFYIMNKLKDFLFGRHIIRSWEIIPWKKLY